MIDLFADEHLSSARRHFQRFALLALTAGLAACMLHLGRPAGAWRFFLGLRTSWMSREILAFGLFAGAAFVATALCWAVPGSSFALTGLAGAAAMGLLAVFTSVMIYADTRRAFWALPLTAARFYGTSILLGLMAAATMMSWMGLIGAADLASEFRLAMIVSIAVRTLFLGGNFGALCGRCTIPRILVIARSERSINYCRC